MLGLGVGVCNGSWSGKSHAVNKHEAHEAFCCSWIPVTVWEFIRKPITGEFDSWWFFAVEHCKGCTGTLTAILLFFFLWHLCFVLFCVLFIWEEPLEQLGLLSLFQAPSCWFWLSFDMFWTHATTKTVTRHPKTVCWIGQWYQSPGDTCYITLLVLLISLFLIRYESFYCAHTHTHTYIYNYIYIYYIYIYLWYICVCRCQKSF